MILLAAPDMAMTEQDRARLVAVSRMAAWLAVLCVFVMAVSVYLRLDFAGLGCADWPTCYGARLGETTRSMTGLPRLLHRIGATLALLLTIAVVWRAWRPKPLHPAAAYSMWLLALMLLLSIVGVASADSRLVHVNFINILGGIGLVSFSVRTWLAARLPGAPGNSGAWQGSRLLWRIALACVSATIALGVLIGARYAAMACTTLPFCGATVLPPVETLWLLKPIGVLASAPTAGDPANAGLHLLHRFGAVLVVLMLGAICLQGMRKPANRGSARLILSALAATLLIGMAAVASGLELWLTLMHGLCAAGLIAALARQQVVDRLQR